jgi:hypothetical protein
MKTISVSQEVLWGLKSFLNVVPASDLCTLYPELGVKSVMRLQTIEDVVKEKFETSTFNGALQTIEKAINEYRSVLLASYQEGGAILSQEEDMALGAKIKERFGELQKETVTDELKALKIDFELSDEKTELLKNVFEKLGAKYLINKDIVVTIAKELGIEE